MPDDVCRMSGNPWKSASIIQIFAIAALLVTGWLASEERFRKLENRILQLEEDSKTLAPISNIMRGYNPGRAGSDAYAAVQATGPENVGQPGTDNSLAWCPATEDSGGEWLELRYSAPVSATEIRIHASFNPGAVVRVLAGNAAGELMEIWAGEGVAQAIQKVAVSPPAEITVVKLVLDTSKVPGWNQIDAVALVDGTGKAHHADTASASSEWRVADAALQTNE
jgi:hypothetical protein